MIDSKKKLTKSRNDRFAVVWARLPHRQLVRPIHSRYMALVEQKSVLKMIDLKRKTHKSSKQRFVVVLARLSHRQLIRRLHSRYKAVVEQKYVLVIKKDDRFQKKTHKKSKRPFRSRLGLSSPSPSHTYNT
jgi:hypothetical protein